VVKTRGGRQKEGTVVLVAVQCRVQSDEGLVTPS